MHPVRNRLWDFFILLLAAVACWPAHHLNLWTLRLLFQFGEWAGVTQRPPAPGASWGGQVAGFTFARPPHWWDFTCGCLHVAIPMWLVFDLMLWCRALRWPAQVRPAQSSLLLASAAGAALAGLLDRFGRTWLMWKSIDFFEALGGSVTRLGGPVMMGPGGPFSGTTLADVAGNWFVRWGPWLVIVVVSAALSLLLHARWKRRPPVVSCARCSYDRRGIAKEAPCPECGAASEAASAACRPHA